MIDLHRILRAFGLGKIFEGDHPGVRPGESFVMRPSRWSGSVGGCVWLVLCVMLMSSWEDGFADTGDLASDHHGGIGHPRSVVSRCDAEALGGAKTEVRGLVTKLYSMVKEENIPNKILNIHSLLAMQDRPSSEAMSEYLYKRNEHALRRSDAEEIGGAVCGLGAAAGLMWSVVHMWIVVDVSVWCVSDDSVVSRCDAEAPGGAKTEVRGRVTKLYSMVKEENIPNKILNIHSLLAMQDRPSSEAMSEYLYKRYERALRRSDEEEIGGDVQVLEVRVVGILEDELAKTQVDAVNTDVMNTESVRPWSVESVEGEVLCVSYSVLGIYFGRRR